MPRFFVGSSQIAENTVTLTGDDAHHISRSLRMAKGQEITVSDYAGNEYTCCLSSFTEDAVTATILSCRKQDTEPPLEITLYQALPKGDKLDTVIQKSVECGASRIVPFESERCIVRCKREAEAHKTARRQRIALEAAKQCGRGRLPEVLETVSFSEMLAEAGRADRVLFCYEGDGTVPIGKLLSAEDFPKKGSLALIVGSEGGFSLKEAEAARAAGFAMTGLGRRILRTETAPLFALAAISCVLELS